MQQRKQPDLKEEIIYGVFRKKKEENPPKSFKQTGYSDGCRLVDREVERKGAEE